MRHKPRVLHLINSHVYSGAENVIITIMENTQHDVCSCYASPVGSIQDVLKEKRLNYIPIQEKNLSPANIKAVINYYKPDIIHAHDFRAGIFSCMTMTSVPIINHLHNNSPWLKRYSAYTVLYAICCSRFKQILTVSDSVMDEFVFGRFFQSKNQVIGNPFDAERIQKLSESANLQDPSDVIFIGRLTPQKNIFFLLEVVRLLSLQIPTIRVAIVGDGELRHDMEKRINDLCLTKNIKIYGFQKNPYGLLKKSSVLCMPSKWEGFGLAAAEALSLGVPVICSGVGGLKDVVDDSCGKLCRFDLEEYVDEIIKCLTNNMYKFKKSISAKKKAKELSNLSNYTNKIRRIYRNVIM